MAGISLSPLQNSVVRSPIGGATLVLASAGSGKTRVLTERVRHILANTKKEGIIAFTFTNAAAMRLAQRLEDLAETTSRLWVGTIHSIAQRIIEQYGHTIGLPANFHVFERDQDRMEIFIQSLRDSGANIDEYLAVTDEREQKSRERVVQRYLSAFSVIKREMLTEAEAQGRFPSEPSIWQSFENYNRALAGSDGIDFDDILVFAHRILLLQDWVSDIYRAKFKHVCVDEAQDLNRIQYEFIRAFCGTSISSILVVGDPNQMIYGFNGSSAEFMTARFVQDFRASTISLNENYRSTRAVIAAANRLKPNSQAVSDYALAGGFDIRSFSDETAEAQGVIRTIKNLLVLATHQEIEGPISLDKMVVIARNRFAFAALEDGLMDEGLPFTLYKAERTLEAISMFGRVLDYGLRLKINPKDWVDANKLATLLNLNVKAQSGEVIPLKWFASHISGEKTYFPKIQSDLLMRLENLADDEPNIRRLVSELTAELTSMASLDLTETERLELERSIYELREFYDCWTRFKAKGLGSSLSAFRNAMALGQLAAETQVGGLTLSTVHQMKGLEKDIVFLIQMCEGVFPDYRAQTPLQIEEERNAAFVAVTRTRRWLYMSYPSTRKMPWGGTRSQKRSRFLDQIEGYGEFDNS